MQTSYGPVGGGVGVPGGVPGGVPVGVPRGIALPVGGAPCGRGRDCACIEIDAIAVRHAIAAQQFFEALFIADLVRRMAVLAPCIGAHARA